MVSGLPVWERDGRRARPSRGYMDLGGIEVQLEAMVSDGNSTKSRGRQLLRLLLRLLDGDLGYLRLLYIQVLVYNTRSSTARARAR